MVCESAYYSARHTIRMEVLGNLRLSLISEDMKDLLYLLRSSFEDQEAHQDPGTSNRSHIPTYNASSMQQSKTGRRKWQETRAGFAKIRGLVYNA
jgi:hypothetical protein